MALHKTARAMSSLSGGPCFHWSSEAQGNLGLYQLGKLLHVKEGPAQAATVLIISQAEAAELGPILTRFGQTGLLD